jgi:hypothetical protein
MIGVAADRVQIDLRDDGLPVDLSRSPAQGPESVSESDTVQAWCGSP